MHKLSKLDNVLYRATKENNSRKANRPACLQTWISHLFHIVFNEKIFGKLAGQGPHTVIFNSHSPSKFKNGVNLLQSKYGNIILEFLKLPIRKRMKKPQKVVQENIHVMVIYMYIGLLTQSYHDLRF